MATTRHINFADAVDPQDAVPLHQVQSLVAAATTGAVSSTGHAAESVLVSIAGTVSDLAVAASRIVGRGAAGDVAALTAAAVKTILAISFSDIAGALLAAQFPALTGDVTTTAGSLATTLANLPQAVLLARAAALTAPLAVNAQKITGVADPANPQDAATKHYVDASFSGGVPLVDGNKGDITVSGSGATWLINALAVTFAKMQNIPTQTLVGRQTAGTGSPESIGVGGGIEFDGAGNIRRSALTGDVSASAGSAGTVINPNVVTNAQLAQVPTGTLKGRTAAGTGNTSDITFAAVKAALAIVFADITGTLQAAQFPALTGDVTTVAGSLATTLAASGVGAGTYGDASHVAQVTVDAKGRVTAASSPSISISAGAVSGLSTVQTGPLTGDVTKPAGSGTTTLANIPNDTPMAGDLLSAAIAAPATPAAGKGRIYTDSTSKALTHKNDAGVVTHTVKTFPSTTNQVVYAIDDDGTVHATQVAFSNLAGTIAAPQIQVPANTVLGNNTGVTADVLALSPAQLRTMLGLDNPRHFDLLLSYGTGDGTNTECITPQSAGPGNWPFFLLPHSTNKDHPNNAYSGGNHDANLIDTTPINNWPVQGTFTHGEMSVSCAHIDGLLGGGSVVFILVRNGSVDSSPLTVTITAGGNVPSGVVSLGAFSFAPGDNVGVRCQVLGGGAGAHLKTTVSLRLTP